MRRGSRRSLPGRRWELVVAVAAVVVGSRVGTWSGWKVDRWNLTSSFVWLVSTRSRGGRVEKEDERG